MARASFRRVPASWLPAILLLIVLWLTPAWPASAGGGAARLPAPAARPAGWQPGELLVRLCASDLLRGGSARHNHRSRPGGGRAAPCLGPRRADRSLPGSGLYRVHGRARPRRGGGGGGAGGQRRGPLRRAELPPPGRPEHPTIRSTRPTSGPCPRSTPPTAGTSPPAKRPLSWPTSTPAWRPTTPTSAASSSPGTISSITTPTPTTTTATAPTPPGSWPRQSQQRGWRHRGLLGLPGHAGQDPR